MYGAEFFVCSFEHVAFVSGWRVGLCSSHVSFQKSSNFVMERGCEVCVLSPARNARRCMRWREHGGQVLKEDPESPPQGQAPVGGPGVRLRMLFFGCRGFVVGRTCF